jgi:hypothetical protein
MRRLQQRVRDLENELDRVQAENDALLTSHSELAELDRPVREPALT